MYKLMDLKEKPADFEKRVREYWETSSVSEKSITAKDGSPRFVFFEGPPTANGKPGIHHVLSRAIKDSVCRYKTMKGYQVKRKAGWDTHGLPVEIEVEKKLGLSDKKSIEEYGVEKFNTECKHSVFSYEKEWREMTKTMGYWIDLDNPYITLDNNYIETIWWILNDFFKKDLIYKGYKIVPYCPSCGTPLSSHEVAQGYKDVEDPSVFVKFKAVDEENTFYLAWTTTPWTLISNVALAVNPDEKYVKVLHNGEQLILAKERLSVLDGDYSFLEEIVGIDLQFREYEQLFPFIKPDKKAFYLVCADYVSMTDGSGIVHTAPAFGQDDYTLGMANNLPFIQPVDDAGKFTEEITDWQGLFVKDADKGIIKNLKDRGLLYKRAQIIHSYPFCWRSDTPLIYYATTTWYIKTSMYKEKILYNNSQVNWDAGYVGEKLFGAWFETNVGLELSRTSVWGTPLNIWVCEECGQLESVGSIADLRKKGRMTDGTEVPENIELHRPYIDNVIIDCPKCKSKMIRTTEVIDCWFDSGSMPFSQWHYPFENADIFEKELFPADFICEGIDQTRGWFYTLLAISTILKGVSPYKNVLVNDLILDKNGQKMSKSKGNSINPMELMQQYGADAIRWYLLVVSPPWVPTKFDVKGVEEVVSKFIGTLKNVYSFYATYANIDGFNALDYTQTEPQTLDLDRWIISRLNSVLAEVSDNNEKYDFTRSLRAIQNFVQDEVSNWYVRRSRRRYWSLVLDADKKDAYLTLYQVLTTLCKMIAPFAPYLSEEIYCNLTGEESVHLADYPKVNNGLIDKKLEKEMQIVIDLVSLGRAARNTCQIKVRQTLQALSIPEKFQYITERVEDLIKEEINVKEILYISPQDDLVKYEIKPNFKILGPKYSKEMKAITNGLLNADANQMVASFARNNPFELSTESGVFSLVEEDVMVSIKSKEGFVFETYKDAFVALNTVLTPELILEGYARELVNKVQFTRKELNFNIMDRILIFYCGDAEIENVFNKFGEYIQSETLTDKIFREDTVDESMKSWDINGKTVYFNLKRV